MFVIGPHVTIAKGFLHAAKTAESIGANTFQYFSRNPRGGAVKELNLKDLDAAQTFMKDHHFGPILCHAPYTLNMASSREEARDFAYRAFKEDLERLESIPCSLYNFHPGSHTKAGVEQGTIWIQEILNRVLWEEMTSTVLLETMAGKGTEIGRSFEEIAAILEGVDLNEKMGVCLDTCHIFSAGYSLKALDETLAAFDAIIGLDRLMAIHLNDSKTPFGAGKDRHEKLGEGEIGMEAIEQIVCHPLLQDLPFFLETPNELDGYQREIEQLKEMRRRAQLSV